MNKHLSCENSDTGDISQHGCRVYKLTSYQWLSYLRQLNTKLFLVNDDIASLLTTLNIIYCLTLNFFFRTCSRLRFICVRPKWEQHIGPMTLNSRLGGWAVTTGRISPPGVKIYDERKWNIADRNVIERDARKIPTNVTAVLTRRPRDRIAGDKGKLTEMADKMIEITPSTEVGSIEKAEHSGGRSWIDIKGSVMIKILLEYLSSLRDSDVLDGNNKNIFWRQAVKWELCVPVFKSMSILFRIARLLLSWTNLITWAVFWRASQWFHACLIIYVHTHRHFSTVKGFIWNCIL